MRFILFLFFSLTYTLGLTQVLEHGIDSAAEREWFIRPYIAPSGDNGFIREEYVLDREQQILFLSCDDSTEVSWVLTEFPDECMKAYDKSYAANKDNKLANKRLRACTDAHYKKVENHQKSDTIYIERNSSLLMDPLPDQDDQYFACSVEISDSLGLFKYIAFYYTIDELKNQCVSGNNFRTKRLESWSNGKKHGDWVYYDLYGNVICTETFHEGVLKAQICK